MSIGIAGAGAFGTALAIAIARGGTPVTLWGREVSTLRDTRTTPRLPGVTLPEAIAVTDRLADLTAATLLLAVPMQSLAALLARTDLPQAACFVACCKGIDLSTGTGPTALIAAARPGCAAAILTGPSFAADIARGLPTALTLACADADQGAHLQRQLSTETLRIYRSGDPLGAELGGALKNVVAIAAGIVIGAGYGDSARAALMARGFAEMRRLAHRLGAQPDTLNGLSGFGDLVLTCTSAQSRNFSFGQALGRGDAFDASRTVEGRATATAALSLAARHGVDMPITSMVSALVEGRLTVPDAMRGLLSRDLKPE